VTIPVDDSTSLGTVLTAGGEVWLASLADTAARYPALTEDTVAAGLDSTASLALRDSQQRVIGAMGVAWAQAQQFTDEQKDEVRVVARLAADALRRAQLLEAERAARENIERLQRTMTALVASASLAEVTAAVFQDGQPPFGASAARLSLASQEQPELLVTLKAAGVPGRALAEGTVRPAPHWLSREAMQTPAAVYVPTPADMAARFPEAHQALHGCGHQAWAALPLHSGGRRLGLLTLAFARPYPLDSGPGEIVLTALGSAIADALSRAIQHDSDRDLVESVQRSLLAGVLPERPGVRLGAHYMPAETRYGVGGDWYDAVPLPGDRILLFVGDVAGHGLTAAITMGQMRSAARALARPTVRPPCSRRWTGLPAAPSRARSRPPRAPSSTRRKERSGTAWPVTRHCCCADPTGSSPRSKRHGGPCWAWTPDPAPSRSSPSRPAASSCCSPTGWWNGAARPLMTDLAGSSSRSRPRTPLIRPACARPWPRSRFRPRAAPTTRPSSAPTSPDGQGADGWPGCAAISVSS
jgi:GAF domain-containing protein